MRFDFAIPTRIIFGPNAVNEVGVEASSLGQHVLFVLGGSSRHAAGVMKLFKDIGLSVSVFHVYGEPTVAVVNSGLQQARGLSCDLVVGMGGGSVLDTGKAIAGLLSNPGDIFDYLENVGAGKTMARPAVPYIAIPTTAGTGSEVTRNAVLQVPEKRIKVSLRSTILFPSLAIVDPELTYSMPPEVTAASGLDALTQLVEALLSNTASPMTDALCWEGIPRAARSLRLAFEDGSNSRSREDMSLASLLSGMALANTKLGAVHGLAGPIGGMFPAPHGAVCARLLAVTVEANLQALRARSAQHLAVTRFTEIGRLLTGDVHARAEDGIEWLHELCETLKVPSLATYGMKESDFEEIAQKALKTSSMKGNPIELTKDELMGILAKAL